MNRIPGFMVSRPVLTIMMLLIVVLLGAASLANLPLDLYPRLDFPVAVAAVRFDGAAPEEVESLVIRPLEENLSTINNVKKVSSESREDIGIIVVEFDWGTNIDMATLQMRERIDRVKGMLPDGVDQPLVMKFDPASQPIIIAAVSGEGDAAVIRRIADDIVKPRLERLDGVASVSVTGGAVREIQVEADPERLQAYGISLAQISQAMRARNLNLSAGNVSEGRSDLLLRTTGEFRSLDDVRNLIVPSPGGPVRLRDVATVNDTFKDPANRTRMDGRTSVGISLLKQTEANTVQVSRRVKEEIADLERELPQGIRVGIVLDQAEFIRDSVSNVFNRTVEGSVLAVVILFLFLRNLRSTLVVASSIPISLLGAFSLLYFSNLTLNMISLGGLALGVGRLVDDAIVVLENIYRHREEGKSAKDAAVEGTAEVLSAITGVTLTTVAVFMPVVFTEGLAGRIFREMSLAVSFALLASLFIAMTGIPLLASRLLRGVRIRAPQAAAASPDAPLRMSRLQGRYYKVIGWGLGHRKAVIALTALSFFASLALIPMIGSEFLPRMDEGQVAVTIELPRGTSLAETDRVVAEVERLARALPEAETVFASTGTSSTGPFGPTGAGKDTGSVEIKLVRLKERDRRTGEVVAELRERVATIPGARFTVAESGGAGGGAFGDKPITINIKGDDLATLTRLGDEVAARVRRIESTREVETSTGETLPELRVVVDRDKAAAYGLTTAQVGQAMRAAVAGEIATRYRAGGEEVDIRLRLEERARRDRFSLLQLPLLSVQGVPLTLGDIARLEEGRGPDSIKRDGQVRAVAVTGDVEGRSVGPVMAEVMAGLKDIGLPPGYTIEYGGEQKRMADSFGALGLALLVGILLVYMILAAEFESLIHPFTIMVSVPLGLIGVILGLVVTGRTFNIASFIGFIMLTGIVVSNAIVLIDYIITLRRAGLPRDEAIRRGGAVRLRPVLMTALTTIIGLFPLALGIGEGAEFQAPMATVVFFGLLVSTVLTLVVVPVIYSLFDDMGKILTRRRRAGEGEVGHEVMATQF